MYLSKLLKKAYIHYSDEFYGSWAYWNSSLVAMNLYRKMEDLFRMYIKEKNYEVLDLGAGRLPFRSIILKYSSNYYSLDFKKTHKDLDYIGVASDTKLASERFDVVFCNQVLEHVPDPLNSFIEIYRILKPGGIGIISTPFLIELHNEPYDYYRYTKYALVDLSEKARFDVVEISAVGGIFSILGRYLSKFFIVGFYWIPIIRYLAIVVNYIVQRLLGFFDSLFGFENVFPSEYVLVVKRI